ncbi:MAG TPA: diacylglycerol kinase family protein [Dehalococcoidales bacterium]|nr:diacylglycerol kinase family protein [Dehalococcoidales bacterium]
MSSIYAKVIVNPAAGAGKTARLWPQIMGLFQRQGLRFEHELTEAPGHAIEMARIAARNGYDMVVSVGGDGTINEIVNGLYAAGNIKDAVLGIVSTGTGSDYIRTIGIPRRYEDACRCFLRPKKLTVDLGVVEYSSNGNMAERLFVNFAGMGFDAEIVRRTTQQYKALGGLPSYLMGTLTTLFTYKNKDIYLKVDGEEVEKRVCTVVMNNGRYGGGGMFTAPDASINDGYFDVMIVGDMSKPDLLRSLPRIYKGTHLTHPKVTMKRAKEIEIRSAQPMQLQADGELLGQVPARFRILPSALNVII